jgi:hypothetical protein
MKAVACRKAEIGAHRLGLALTLLLGPLLTGCEGGLGATPTPEPMPSVVRVLAGDLAYDLGVDLAAAFNPTRRDVVVVVEPGPVAEASEAARSGSADLALIASAGSEGFQTPIGSIAVVPVGHPANSVRALTLDQLRRILIGDIRDWGTVAGTPGPIQVIAPVPGSDLAAQLDLALSANGQLTSDALLAPTWDATSLLVPQYPGAIGFLPVHRLDSGVVALADPLSVLVVAMASSEPRGAARDFLNWVQSDAGQQIVDRRFEPIR